MLFWIVPSLLLFATELISVCSGDAIIVKLHDLRALNLEPHKGQTLSMQFLIGKTHREYLKASEGGMSIVPDENFATLSIPDKNDELAKRLFSILINVKGHNTKDYADDKLSLEFKVQEGIMKRKTINRRCVWLAGEGSGGAAKLTAKELWYTQGDREAKWVQQEPGPSIGGIHKETGHYHKEPQTWHLEVHAKDIGECPHSALAVHHQLADYITSKGSRRGSPGSGSSGAGASGSSHHEHSSKQQHLWMVRHGDREDKAADKAVKDKWAMDHGPRKVAEDPPLSPLGQKQARETGKRIRQLLLGAAQNGDHKIDVVVVSPYIRCLETAKLIIDQLGEHLADPHRVLMEIGVAESPAYANGKTNFLKSAKDVNHFVNSADAYKKRFVSVDPHYSSCYTEEQLLENNEHPPKFVNGRYDPKGGDELNAKIQNRMTQTLNCLLGKEKGNVLVVSHMADIMMAGITLSNDAKRDIERASISEFSRDISSGTGAEQQGKEPMKQHWKLVLSNAVGHMSDTTGDNGIARA